MSRDVCSLSSKQQKYLEDHPRTCKWLVTPIYKPFRPFGRGTILSLGDLLTMVINHVSKSWEDPPSMSILINSVQKEILPSKFPKIRGQIQKTHGTKYKLVDFFFATRFCKTYATVKLNHFTELSGESIKAICENVKQYVKSPPLSSFDITITQRKIQFLSW